MKKRFAVLGATLLTAGAVLATTAPAVQAAPDAGTAVEIASSAIYGSVGNVHMKITNDTPNDVNIWFNAAADGGHWRTIKPGNSYTVQGHSGNYGMNETFVDVYAANGSFTATGYNYTIWKPPIKVVPISGKKSDWILRDTKTGSITGSLGVTENYEWGFDKGDDRMIVKRHKDGHSSSSKVKNFEILLTKIR